MFFLIAFKAAFVLNLNKYLFFYSQVDWKHETAQWVFLFDLTSKLWEFNLAQHITFSALMHHIYNTRGVHVLLATQRSCVNALLVFIYRRQRG